jgi:hypothetical protein
MDFYPAYYSIIQFCPDRGRSEAANVGVLLFCPALAFVGAKTATGNERVSRFFGKNSFDPARLKLIKRAFEQRIRERFEWPEGLADLEHLIASRANDLQLTAARSMKTANPEADLDGLFRELVEERRSSRERALPVAFARLRTALRAPGLKERIAFNTKIEVPVLGRELAIPYAYQNGALNLVKPHAFRGAVESVTRQASELAVEGDLLRRHSDLMPRQLIVIPAYMDESREASESISELFAEYHVRVVAEEHVDDLVNEIAQTAH